MVSGVADLKINLLFKSLGKLKTVLKMQKICFEKPKAIFKSVGHSKQVQSNSKMAKITQKKSK